MFDSFKVSKPILILLVLSFCIWSFFGWFSGPLKGVDEVDHYKVVKSYANLSWPILIGGTSPYGRNTTSNQLISRLKMVSYSGKIYYGFQAQHPPLYYWSGAVFYKVGDFIFGNKTLVGEQNTYFVTRLNSFIYYAVILIFVYKALSLYFSRKVSLILALAAGFQLNLIQVAVNINNDIGASALAAVFFYHLLLFLKNRESLSPKKALFFGLLTGLSVLFKLYNLILIPVFVSCTFWVFRKEWKNLIKSWVVYLAAVFFLVLPWLLVNLFIYEQLLPDNYQILSASKNETVFHIMLGVINNFFFSVLRWSGFSAMTITEFLFNPIPFLSVWIYFLLVSFLIVCGGVFLYKNRTYFKELNLILASAIIFGVLFFLYRTLSVIVIAHYYYVLSARYYLMFLVPVVLIFAFGLRQIRWVNMEKLAVYALGLSLYYYLAYFVVHF